VADRIKFHLDEHVDPDIAKALRRHGLDVTTTVEAGLRTLDDPDYLDFIRREGRVVVTHDADFLRYASRKGIV
jgi:predicted nuclease of predicted toxin-antitoxin system